MAKRAVFLEGKQVYLSPLNAADITAYYKFINNPKNDIFTEHSEFPHTKAQLKEYISAKKRDKCSVFLGVFVKRTQRHVGNIELTNINLIHGTGELKIVIDCAASGKGLGYDASKTLIEYAFNKLNLYKINLGVNSSNKPAVQLYRKLGFKEEGRLKKQLLQRGIRSDIIVMSLFNDKGK